MKNCKKIVATLLIVSVMCTSCKMFATQKMIDNIIPDHNKRMYSVADLIPYDYKELKNARALYGMELQDYFLQNTTTESELKRTTEKQKNDFVMELMMRTHNYKIIKQRYAMYANENNEYSELKEAERKKEYDAYYSIGNAKGIGTIKKYNDGKAEGVPLMSARAILDTATDSDASGIYSEIMCEIYKPVTIDEKKYGKMKYGDTITLDITATNSTVNCKKTIKRTFTYISTDSLLYKDDDGNDKYYFIAANDGKNDVRRVLDYYGKTLETYVETKPLQFLKYCRVVDRTSLYRMLVAVVNESLDEYKMDEIAERAMCGGYLIYKYKDNVYANYITTNPKGYVTSFIDFSNQRIDNPFYKKLVE